MGSFLFNYVGTQMRPASIQGPVVSSSFTYAPNNAPGHSARALTGISHSFNGSELAGHTYTLDKAGRITSWQKRSSVGPTVNQTFTHNLRDELLEASSRDASQNLINQEIWGLDHGGNWLSYSQSQTSLMQTRTVNILNQFTQMGGAGDVVVAGHVNERSAVTVNGQAAVMQADPVSTGFLFRKPISVTPGSNTVEISAVDEDDPPNTTTQTWSFTVPPPQRTFQYDASGNMTSDSNGRTLTWDAKNCPSLRSRPAKSLRMDDAAIAAKQGLKTVTVSGTTYEWDYDYRDRRVREYVYASGGSKPTVPAKQFVWHDNEIVQERVGTSATAGTISRNHYYGGFTIGATVSTAAKYQTFTDHLGHVREVVAASGTNPAIGTVLTRYDYTPYQGPKKVHQHSGTNVEATFQTIGRYYHHEPSGLELALYRAYDPELGRWISEDPLGEEGGLNLYGFVEGEPVGRIDLLGLNPGVGCVIGATAGEWLVSIGATAFVVDAVFQCIESARQKKCRKLCNQIFLAEDKVCDQLPDGPPFWYRTKCHQDALRDLKICLGGCK